MERWKEILLQDLKNVAKGFNEAGKAVVKVEEAITHIPNLDKKAIIALLSQNELRYFAAKVDNDDYEKVAELQEQKASK